MISNNENCALRTLASLLFLQPKSWVLVPGDLTQSAMEGDSWVFVTTGEIIFSLVTFTTLIWGKVPMLLK